jgi:Helix-turn-helix domain
MTTSPRPITDDLPMFLTVRDLQRLLQVSRSEAYAIAHTIGVSRIGRRLVRVPREAFLRWRAERIAESETDRGWSRWPFPRAD